MTDETRGAAVPAGRTRGPPPAPSLASDRVFRALAFLVALFATVQLFVAWDFQSDLRHGQSVGGDDVRPDRNDEGGAGEEEDPRRDGTVAERADASADAAMMDIPALLRRAGIAVDVATKAKLPTPSEVASMYGPRPVVRGLDSCAAYRAAVRPRDRLVAPAGLFNAGTNNLAVLLRRNCYIPQREGAREDRWKSGMRFQVPWGKHNPVSWRLRNVAAQGGQGVVQGNVLPVVAIRDPVSWMASMCRHPYGVRLGRNCDVDGKFASGVYPVSVPYKPRNVTEYDSLVDLWRTWYEDWTTAARRGRDDGVPYAVFVRFEDLLFHPDAVVRRVCDCAGGTRRDGLYLREGTAKGEVGPHAGGSGLLDAIVENGNATRRRNALRSREDREHLTEDRFSDLLAEFHYSVEGIR